MSRIDQETGAFSIATEHKKQTRTELTPLVRFSETRGFVLVNILRLNLQGGHFGNETEKFCSRTQISKFLHHVKIVKF